MLDQAIEALSSYDWGKDYSAIKPIEDAVVATQGDAEARKTLEEKLAGVLTSGRFASCERLRLSTIANHRNRSLGSRDCQFVVGQRSIAYGALRTGK